MSRNGHDAPGPGDDDGLAFAVATGIERRAVAQAISAERSPDRADPAILECGIGCPDMRLPAGNVRVRSLVSTGFAAALDPNLAPGSVLLPAEVVPPSGSAIPVSRDLHRRVHAALAQFFTVSTAPLAGADTIVRSPAEKRSLFERTGAAGADMESVRLALLSARQEIPFLVVRVVLDPAEATIPRAVVPRGHRPPRPWSIVRDLARRPDELRPFLALMRYVPGSRRVLIAAVRSAIGTLAAEPLS